MVPTEKRCRVHTLFFFMWVRASVCASTSFSREFARMSKRGCVRAPPTTKKKKQAFLDNIAAAYAVMARQGEAKGGGLTGESYPTASSRVLSSTLLPL